MQIVIIYLKGIAHALFMNDKYIASSFDFYTLKIRKGKVEIKK